MARRDDADDRDAVTWADAEIAKSRERKAIEKQLKPEAGKLQSTKDKYKSDLDQIA
jgi:hypothetical protein